MMSDKRYDSPEIQEEYLPLFDVLMSAFRQAQEGKGKERHANVNEPFADQLICCVERAGVGFVGGQAIKKIVESHRLPPEQAIEELYGAIVYIAARVLILKEKISPQKG